MKLRICLVLAALVPAALLSCAEAALAQAQPAPSSSETSPASPSPQGTSPAPAPAAPPVPPPPAAQNAPPGPTAQAADPFGQETRLEARKVVSTKGTASWETAFDTLTESLRSLNAALDKQGIKPSGNPLIVYTSTDDTGFTFLAEVPVDQEPKNLPKAITIGQSPDGRALKFVHRGSYDNMDNTYEAITNYLDDKRLEARDTFVEEYLTDPLNTAEDKLVINVYVPLK